MMKSARERASLVEDDELSNGAAKGMSIPWLDIGISFFITTIPMLLFCGILFGLIFHYQVTPGSSSLSQTSNPAETGVFYVHLSGTVLIFIASWSSSLAPVLSGFILNLIAYPIARQHISRVQSQDYWSLPTPFQLGLTLKFISGGGWAALWSWAMYLIRWPKQKSSDVLSASAKTTMLVTLLSVIVFAADTWLHLVTKTVPLTLTSPINSGGLYGMELIPGCTVNNNSFSAASTIGAPVCNVNPAGTRIYLINTQQTNEVLINTSDTISVLNNSPDPTYAYLGRTPNNELANLDYTAGTFGMRTECKPVSRQCNLDAAYGAATFFNCSETFSGNLEVKTFSSDYFPDDSMSISNPISGVPNPFYFGVAKLVINANTTDAIRNDPAFQVTTHGELTFVLLCTVTVYDVEYDLVNGSVTRFVAAPSNDSVANVWETPLATTFAADTSLQLALETAATSAKDGQSLADYFAIAYSKIALAVGSQSVQLAPAKKVQSRDTILVSRVPWAPLFCLIGANLLYAMLGIISTIFALVASSKKGVSDAHARLSVFGLAADRFEQPRSSKPVHKMEEWFEESEGRETAGVGVFRSQYGGWTYSSMPRESGSTAGQY